LAIDVLSALNWAIAKDEPLHLALKGLSGKRLQVVLPVLGSLDWEIEADGLLKEIGLRHQAAQGNSTGLRREPDVTLRFSTEISRGPRIEGDAMVVERLAPLAKLMKDRLSPWEHFWNQSPAGQLARQAAEFAVHEAGVLVSRQQIAEHDQMLRNFRDALDRLEKRIDALSRA
jgi:ubiquinone biosynthesis protein UbiJ